MSLKEYNKKRNFNLSREPKAKNQKDEKNLKNEKSVKDSIFVIQKHFATRLHYDFRLEVDGVLKSWAVPKGIPVNPNEKRLAVETEDHPLEYASFKGFIPKGEYGAGKVEIFDSGFYEIISKTKSGKIMSTKGALRSGRIEIFFKGKKIKGEYALLRTNMSGNSKNWLIFKKNPNRK